MLSAFTSALPHTYLLGLPCPVFVFDVPLKQSELVVSNGKLLIFCSIHCIGHLFLDGYLKYNQTKEAYTQPVLRTIFGTVTNNDSYGCKSLMSLLRKQVPSVIVALLLRLAAASFR